MRNGTTLQVGNPPDRDPELLGCWTNNLMSRLRPGGTWVVPRSVSMVVVISHDPRAAQAHCIFPDPRLLAVLRAAGWRVYLRDEQEAA